MERGALGVLLGVAVALAIVVGVVITWFGFFPAIGITSDVELEIVTTAGHTIWDSSERLVMVEVARGNDSVELLGFNLIFVFGDEKVRHFVDGDLDANSAGIYYVDLSNYSGELEEIMLAPVFVGGEEGKVSSRFKVNDKWGFKNVSEIEDIVVPNGGSSSGGGGGGGGSSSSVGETTTSCDSESVATTCGDRVCGDRANNCGDVVNCGSCASDYLCQDGFCVPMFTDIIFVDKTLVDCVDGYSFIDRECGSDNETSYDTVQEALNVVQPGEKIIIMGGVNENSDDSIYSVSCNGMNLVNSGTVDNRIFVESYSGHSVVINGSGGCDGIEFDGGGANYYTIRGIHFDNFNKGTEGSYLVRKEGLIIEDCEFSHLADRGVIFRNVHDSIIRDVYVHDVYETGIILRQGSDNVTISNVLSADNDDGKGSEGDSDGFLTGYGVGSVMFINCTARDNAEDGFDITGENVTLVNCKASGHSACGIKFWKRTYAVDNYYTLINSMSYDNEEAGIKISQGSDSLAGDFDTRIYNSLLYGNGEEGVAIRNDYAQVDASVEIKNTIFHSNGQIWTTAPTLGVGTGEWNIDSNYNIYYDNGDAGYSNEGSSSLFDTDPGLFAPGVFDFHLKGDSVAIDSGVDLSSIFNYDFEGSSRSEFDIGPFERIDVADNSGPSFSYGGATSFQVNEGEELVINLPAVDPEGNELRYLLTSGDIVSEMSVDNEGNFRFTPNFDSSTSLVDNVFNIVVGVTDEYYFYPPSELGISITVLDVNRAPVYIGLDYYTLIEGRGSKLKLSITDLDGSIGVNSLLSGLPSSASYDSSTEILSWTPALGDVGVNTFVLDVDDGIDSNSYDIVFDVLSETPYEAPTNEADIFYVDGSSGDNLNDGQTEGTAWETIQKAKNTLTAGQMVLVRGGTYNEYGSVYISGTPGNPIIFKEYPGEDVVMDGTGFSSPEAFNFGGGVSNIVIDGFTMQKFGETIYFRGSNENITLVNLDIFNASSYGVYGSANNIRMENLNLRSIGDRGIYAGNNAHIYNVSISDYEDRGIIAYSDTRDNVNIIKTKIYDSRLMAQNGILAGGKNVYISGVELINNSGPAVSISSDYAYIQNTIVSGTRIRSSSAYNLYFNGGELDFYNNVLYGSSMYGLYFSDSVSSNSRLRNNIIYGNPTEVRIPSGFSFDEDYNIFGDGFTPVGENSMNANPLFVDVANNDFSLQSGSPAIDAGVDVGLIYSGSAPDIGAYEY